MRRLEGRGPPRPPRLWPTTGRPLPTIPPRPQLPLQVQPARHQAIYLCFGLICLAPRAAPGWRICVQPVDSWTALSAHVLVSTPS